MLIAKACCSHWYAVLSAGCDGGTVELFEPINPETRAARRGQNAWHFVARLVPARWLARTVVCVAVAMLDPQPGPKIGPIYVITFAVRLLSV